MQKEQILIDEIVKCCVVNGLTDEQVIMALMSILLSAMRAAGRDECQLADGDGECHMVAKRYK